VKNTFLAMRECWLLPMLLGLHSTSVQCIHLQQCSIVVEPLSLDSVNNREGSVGIVTTTLMRRGSDVGEVRHMHASNMHVPLLVLSLHLAAVLI
jgi:hypothetical protein